MSDVVKILLILLLCCVPIEAQKQPPVGRTASFYLSRGGRMLETGDYSGAILYLEAALRAPRRGVKPAVIQLAEKLLATARIYEEARLDRAAGRIDAAVEKYAQIMRLNPVDPKPLEFIYEVYDYASEAAEKAGDFAEAARLYGAWMSYYPDNPLPREGRIRNLRLAAQKALSDGDKNRAIDFYVLLATATSDPEAVRQIRILQREQDLKGAQNLISSGRLDAAIIELNRLVTVYPQDQEIAELLRITRGRSELERADGSYTLRRYHEAYGYYRRALPLLPEERPRVEKRLREIELRTGADYSSEGFVILSGRLKGASRLVVRGSQVQATAAVLKPIGRGLPERACNVKARRAAGDVVFQIVERPSKTNGYALVLDLQPRQSEEFSLEVDWELAKTGGLTWGATVEGRVLLRLQGPFLDAEGSVLQSSWGGDPLPHAPYELKIERVAGMAALQIVERPSAANDYTTVVKIDAATPERLELQMLWRLAD